MQMFVALVRSNSIIVVGFIIKTHGGSDIFPL